MSGEGEPNPDAERRNGLHAQAVALIRTELTNAEMTQAELAKRLGWSQKHMSEVLTSKAEPSMASIDFMAFVLGIKLTVVSERQR